MFCPECEKVLPDDSKFCAFCGTTIGAETKPVEKNTPTATLPRTTAADKAPKRLRPLTIVVGLALVALIAFGIVSFVRDIQPKAQGPSMTFETIGTKGSTVLITLVSPGPDEVSAQHLANRLKKDWQNEAFPGIPAGHVHVMVYDNKAAPQTLLSIWDSMVTMSDAELAAYDAQIFPHWIANYWRNTSTGLHEVQFLSRDANADLVQTIQF